MEDSAESHQVSSAGGVIMVLVSFVFFQTLNSVLQWLGRPASLGKTTYDFWNYRNVFVSLIHALISGPLALYCLIAIKGYWVDPVHYVDAWGYTLLSISSGYFIYDTVDFILNATFQQSWPICLHHLLSFVAVFFEVAHSTCLSYGIIGMFAELSSIVLHVRKLLQLFQIRRDDVRYRLVCWLNFLAYFVIRITALIWGFTLAQRTDVRNYFTNAGAYMFAYYIFINFLWIFLAVFYLKFIIYLLQKDILRTYQKKTD